MSELDTAIFRFFHDAFASSGGWLAAMAVLTVVGGGWGALLVVPLFASRRTRRFARYLTAVLAATSTLVFLVKRAVARPRPCACISGVSARVFDAPSDVSVPSGHAAGSFAFAVFVAFAIARAPKLGLASRALAVASLVALACGVALSRVVLGVHCPGDVAAGAALGAAAGAVGAHFHFRRRPVEL